MFLSLSHTRRQSRLWHAPLPYKRKNDAFMIDSFVEKSGQLLESLFDMPAVESLVGRFIIMPNAGINIIVVQLFGVI